MAADARTVIIGLDGVPFEMIEHFAGTGVMPNTAKIISDGVFKKMLSSIPEVSSVAWSSMITGKNPAEHGVFGFMDLLPNSYRMKFPNYNDLKAKPFWEQWPGKSIIINVPSTYPVQPMNGVLISGFVSIDFEKSIYPPSLSPVLQDMDYRLDVDSHKAHTDMEAFLADLDKTLDARIRASQYLWEYCDWQTFMLVFTGTDRLMHFLWEAYENPQHKYHNHFVYHFRRIDQAIGEIAARLNDTDLLLMHSDHGFERLDHEIFINYLLKDQGYLQFGPDDEAALENICPGTKAFALDPARIHLNFQGKYPRGSVTFDQAGELINELYSLFDSLQIDGKKVIRDIYRKEQIYSGPYLDEGPELVLVANEGFNLKASMKSEKLADKGLFTGKHTQDTAFLIVRSPGSEQIVPEKPSVFDIKGIVEKSRA
jgi:predicted AlkP superfamily phosphohydrolase/phosphomutase